MPQTINSWLAQQLKDPEFAQEYRRVSVEMDEQLAAVQTARSTLAKKVLAQVETSARCTYEPESKSAEACRNIAHCLRELFQREGIEVDSTSTSTPLSTL